MRAHFWAQGVQLCRRILGAELGLRDSLQLYLQEGHVGISVLEGLQIWPWLLGRVVLEGVAILDIFDLLPNRRNWGLAASRIVSGLLGSSSRSPGRRSRCAPFFDDAGVLIGRSLLMCTIISHLEAISLTMYISRIVGKVPSGLFHWVLSLPQTILIDVCVLLICRHVISNLLKSNITDKCI